MVSDRNHIRCTNHSLEGMESIGFKPTLLPPPPCAELSTD